MALLFYIHEYNIGSIPSSPQRHYTSASVLIDQLLGRQYTPHHIQHRYSCVVRLCLSASGSDVEAGLKHSTACHVVFRVHTYVTYDSLFEGYFPACGEILWSPLVDGIPPCENASRYLGMSSSLLILPVSIQVPNQVHLGICMYSRY